MTYYAKTYIIITLPVNFIKYILVGVKIMSCSSTAIKEIHKLQSKLEDLVESCSNLSEILEVSEKIDLMLRK